MDFIDSQNRWIPSIGEAKAKGAGFSLEKEVNFVENGAGQEKVASCDSRVPVCLPIWLSHKLPTRCSGSQKGFNNVNGDWNAINKCDHLIAILILMSMLTFMRC